MALAPNEVLGDGRFRLLARRRVDESTGMEFWRAWDFRYQANVAVTALTGDQGSQAAVASARQVLEGIRWAESAAHPALARVIDLLGPGPDGVLGLVVTEWIDGLDLMDAVLDGPMQVAAACRLLRPLVAAVDGAHHMGVVGGVDVPEQIRIGEHGTAVLAFRGTRPHATTRDDVRGLGTLLYFLLTGRLPDAELVAPADLRPDVPRDLSLIAVLSIDGSRTPDIRTCGPLLRAMDEVIAYDPDIETMDLPLLMGPAPVRAEPPPAPEPEEPVRRAPRQPRRGRVVTALAAVVAVAVAVLVGAKVAGAFSGPTPVAARSTVVSVPRTTVPTTTTPPPTTTTPPPPPPQPIRPTAVREYLVSGNPDNADEVGNAIDGDPNTTWPTDIYLQQLPMFIPGLGLMTTLPQPTTLSSITITSPSPGTVVEIHSAPAPDAPLASAPLLATATLTGGATTIPLHMTAPAKYVLVWITQLAQAGTGYGSAIAEISCQPAG